MTNVKIPDFSSLIKHQIQSQEQIFECLNKVNVLLEHALESDLLHKPADFTQYYFWTISDLTEKAAKISEQMLDTLLQNQPARFVMVS